MDDTRDKRINCARGDILERMETQFKVHFHDDGFIGDKWFSIREFEKVKERKHLFSIGEADIC